MSSKKNSFLYIENILLTLLISLSAFAQESSVRPHSAESETVFTLTDEEENWLKHHPKIPIVVERDGAPYSRMNRRGEFTGFLADVFFMVEPLLGVEFEYIGKEYDQLVACVQSREYPVVTGVDPPDVQYEKEYIKTDDINFMPFGLFALEGVTISNLASNRTDTLVVVLEDGWDESHPALQALQPCKFIQVPEADDCINLLLSGEADVYFEVALLAQSMFNEKLIDDIRMVKVSKYGMPLTVLVAKEWGLFASILNKAFATIDSETRIALLHKWKISMEDPSYRLLSIELTEDERAFLVNNPVIPVATDPSYEPIEWYNGEEYVGIAIDYLKLAEERLGISFKITHHATWEQAVKGVEQGHEAMFSCAAKTAEREEYLDFIDPYISLPVNMYVASDKPYIGGINDLYGLRVAVVNDYAIEEIIRSNHPKLDLVEFAEITQALQALEKGEVDAFIGDLLSTGLRQSRLGAKTIKVGGETPYTYDLGMAIRKDVPHLASILDKVYASYSTKERDAIYRKWVRNDTTSFDFSIVWKIGIPLLFIFIGIVAWNRLLAREVNRRTKDLATRHNQLQNAERQAKLGRWAVSRDGKSVEWSTEVYRILGVTNTALKPSKKLYLSKTHPDDQEMVLNFFKRAIGEASIQGLDHRLILKDGTKKYVHLQLASKDFIDSDELGVSGTVQDITERVSIEERLRHSDKLNAIGQLAGGVAHDFNNMLGGIISAAELLRTCTPSEEISKYNDLILDTALKAKDLTQKLLAYGRKQPMTASAIDVKQTIQDSIALLKRTINPNVEIVTKFNDTPMTVLGEVSQLQNAFINLGINASHAMPEGGELSFRTAILNVDASYHKNIDFELSSGPYVDIEICDTGTGIPAQNIPHIFEPFFTTKGSGEGTGLGLAAVYGTITQHGGAISVYSEVGHGTCFRILLPLTNDLEVKSAQLEQGSIYGEGCILVVDDDSVMRVTAKAILEKLGYTVLLAEDGCKGVEMFKENINTIDLVILDMLMPNMNGQESFAQMKEISPNLKAILSSGFTPDEEMASIKGYGLCGFIQKPYSISELSQVVSRAIKSEESEGGSPL